MSSAIAIRGSGLAWDVDYQPVTDSSREIQRTWAQKRNYLQGSASDWLPLLEAAIRSIKDDCTIADWDGSGAIPVSIQTIGLTAKIVETLFTMLPRDTPAPDLIPEAEGEICISWSVDAGRLFSLSVGAHGKINFAGQLGKEGGIHAWQPIDATSRSTLEESLQDITRYVEKLYASTKARRAA